MLPPARTEVRHVLPTFESVIAMALIRYGAMIADARGSIGGVVFARNRGGAYARNRTTPLNPQTVRQIEVRSVLANLSQEWATVLTQDQRDSWDLYADNVPLVNSLGESRNVSGLNMFIRGNSLLADTGGVQIDDGPTIFTVGPTLTPTLTLDSAADTVTVTDLGDYDLADGPVNMLVQQGTPQNGGVQFFKGPFRKIAEVEAVETTGEPPFGPFDLTYPVVAGQAVWFRTATVTPDGRVGVPVIQRFLVA